MEVPSRVPEEHELFGRYRLLNKIASGGMGEIYLARLEGEGGFAKLVIIKRLLPALVASEEFRTMFVNEARITAQLSHPNVCDIYELGQVDEQYFLAMQYLQGVPVSRIARSDRPVDRDHVRLVAGLVEQACAGLHHAHELKDASGRNYHIVHRDVSPSNLFATFDGVVNVLDFGIATMQGVPRMTSKGSIRGKFAYMSPEQISGRSLDRRSDIFSLGIVMFEALTRQRMFDRPSEFLVAKAILEEDYPRARAIASVVPEALSEAVGRALARQPDDRYPTARDMAEAIRGAMAEHGGTMGPAEIGERLREEFAEELAVQRGQYEDATGQFERAPDDATESLAGPMPAPPATTPSVTVATRVLRGRTADPVAIPAEPPAMTTTAAALRRRRIRWGVAGTLVLAAVVAVAVVGIPSGSRTAAAPDAGMRVVAAANVDAGVGGSSAAPPVVAPDASPATSADAGAVPPKRSRSRRASRRATEQTQRAGYLNINSFPFATIYVDGRRIDVTPIPKLPLSPGVHRIRATLQDGRSRSFKVRIVSGKTTRRRLKDW